MVARFVALGVFLAAVGPVRAESAEPHVAAAKKAEKRGEWRKALQEWQAAYRLEINPEYLIGIADAQAHLGNKAEARKQYEAYLADPLALPANAAVVKGKLAALDASGGGAMALELPPGTASAPGLAPPAEPANGKAKKGKKEAPVSPLPGALALAAPAATAAAPPPAPAPAKKESEIALALPELPAAKPAPAAAKKDPAAPPLPILELPGLSTADAGKKPAPAGTATTPAKPATTVAAATPATGTKPAAAKPSAGPETRKAPGEALTSVESLPSPVPSRGGAQRVVAWVAAGVAVAALGGGVLAYTKASSAQSDLTSGVHDGATAQRLLEDEKRNKTLSFVGLAGGLVAAGIATALFTF